MTKVKPTDPADKAEYLQQNSKGCGWELEQEELEAVKHIEREETFSSPLYPGVEFHAIPDAQPDIVEYVRKQTQHEEVNCEVLGNAILFQQELEVSQ